MTFSLTGAYGVPASEKGSSGRSAQGLRVEALQDDARVRKCVDIRSHELVGSMETHVIPSLES